MNRLLAMISLVALTACGSGGKDPIVQAAVEEFGGFWAREDRVPKAPPRVVTRADIVRANVAAIQARLEADPSPTLMYAAASNGGYVTYSSALQQQITLRGAQIAGTRGLGTDLLSAWTETPDPLVRQTPPGNWPARVRRVYELPAEGPRGEVMTFDCYFEPPVPAQMTILQVRYQGVQIAEVCAGPSGGFENLHFVDSSGGRLAQPAMGRAEDGPDRPADPRALYRRLIPVERYGASAPVPACRLTISGDLRERAAKEKGQRRVTLPQV